MKNNRGLSAIITTLIIVGLVMVAIGIVWYVVLPIIEGGAEDIDINSKCLGINIEPIYLSCTDTTPFNCTVKIKRSAASSSDVVDGVEVLLYNSTDDSLGTIDTTDISIGEVETFDATTNADELDGIDSEITRVLTKVYFTDDAGKKHYCSSVNEYP